MTGKTTSSEKPEGPGPKRHPLSHLEAARAALRERFRLPTPPQAGGPGRKRGHPATPHPHEVAPLRTQWRRRQPGAGGKGRERERCNEQQTTKAENKPRETSKEKGKLGEMTEVKELQRKRQDSRTGCHHAYISTYTCTPESLAYKCVYGVGGGPSFLGTKAWGRVRQQSMRVTSR